MLGQSGAIAKRPPHAGGTGHPMAVYATNVTSVTSIGDVLGGNPIPFGGCWVTFVCSVDAYIYFTSSNSGSTPSSSNAFPLKEGVTYDWWVNDTDDPFFRVIRAGTTDGVLCRYRSNL